MSPDVTTAVDELVDNRVELWKEAIHAELHDLLDEASKYKEAISTAKTTTKRQYFEKKQAKVRTLIMQLLVASERINSTPVHGDSHAPLIAN